MEGEGDKPGGGERRFRGAIKAGGVQCGIFKKRNKTAKINNRVHWKDIPAITIKNAQINN